MITVKSLVTNRIALWQKHPDQPGGEVFVAGDIVAEVFPTDEVLVRIRNEFLAETDEPTTPPWPEYDTDMEATILAQLGGEGDTGAVIIRQYEAVNENRASIMTQGV